MKATASPKIRGKDRVVEQQWDQPTIKSYLELKPKIQANNSLKNPQMFYVNSQEELDLSSPEATCILKRMGRKTIEATKCNGTKSNTAAKSSNICKEDFNWMDTSQGGQ